MPNLRQQLRQSLHGRVCLMGLGNPDYGDDGFGVRLAEELAAAGAPDVVIAVANPENFLGPVCERRFDHVVFLDALEFGAAPGSVVLLDSPGMTARFPQVSTHKISLGLLAMWAEANGATKAWLLGVQPESVQPGTALSPRLTKTMAALKQLLLTVQLPDSRELAGATSPSDQRPTTSDYS